MNQMLAKLIFGEDAQAKSGLSDPTTQMLMGNKFNMTAPENIKKATKPAAGKSKEALEIEKWTKETMAKIAADEAAAKTQAEQAQAAEAEAARVAALTPDQKRQEESDKRMGQVTERMQKIISGLSQGQSANMRASLPTIMSPIENEVAIGNAQSAVEGLGIGKAEQDLLGPYYEKQKAEAEGELAGLQDQRDLSGDFLIHNFIAGKDLGYKSTKADKIKDLRKRIDEQMKGRGELANKKDALLEKFYSASKLSPLSFGYGGAEARVPAGKGAPKPKMIPAGQAEKLGAGYELPNRIDSTITYLTNNLNKMGKLNQAGDWIASQVGAESWSSELKAMLESLKQDIGKAKEGGVLRKEDEIKYAKLLPNLGTNPYTALKNLKLMRAEVAGKVKAHKDGLSRAGYDVSGYDALDAGLGKSGGGLSDAKAKRMAELKAKLGK